MGTRLTASPLSIIAQDDDIREEESPYTNGTLSATEQSDLAILVHFLLLFRYQLNISSFELLDSKPEQSVLAGHGIVYTMLISFFSSHYKRSLKALEKKLDKMGSTGARLEHLRELADKAMSAPELRAAMVRRDGRVMGAARLRTSVRDGSGNGYVWLRGSDGCCSERILKREKGSEREVVMRKRESLALVKRLEKGGKRGFMTAGWMKGRVERAGVRGEKIREEEEERVREEERREEERREKEKERIRKLERVQKMVGVEEERFGRGKREKRRVCYEEESAGEEEEDDKDEDFSLGDEEKGRENDGESEKEWDEKDEEDEEDEKEKWQSGEVVVVGRVRVFASGRTTRNNRRAAKDAEGGGRPMRKCRRLVSDRVCDEVEHD